MSGKADLLEKLRLQAEFLRSCGADFAVRDAAGAESRTCHAVRENVAEDLRSASRGAGRGTAAGVLSGVTEAMLPPADGGEAAFAALEEQIRACRKCPLSRLRTKVVPGEGNPRAELMFIGEAPGADEDAQGRPFVGRAGKLLRKIIAAMKFREDEVYITNILKCRPPSNRDPERGEIDVCQPFLLEQIRLIRPRVIVTLGRVPTEFFVPSRLRISALRGTFAEYGGIAVMPTYHPAYLIRNEGNTAIKKMVWDDMQKVMALLGRS